MLKIKPNCEYCDKDLGPASTDARICSYECTFCNDCVENILKNVCPNCGGGFVSRPIRPSAEHRAGVCLVYQPSSKVRVHSKYTLQEIFSFSERLQAIDVKNR